VSLYILAGIRKRDYSSNEAALKYFLMGAFSTGVLLMGIAFIYGAVGSFDLGHLHNYVIENQGGYGLLFYVGLLFLTISLCFKIGAAPFHFWTPDVYEGSPTLITGFMATAVKIAGFASFLRLFSIVFASVWSFWSPVLFGVITLSLFIGNITALYQKTFKRMLAYSSISHVGYLLIAILALGESAGNAVFLYGTAYSLASLVAFAILIKVKERFGSDSLDVFNGLAKKNPYLAFALTAYYFRVIIAMYFKDCFEDAEVALPFNYKLVITICLILTFFLGIYPACLFGLL
jgi:NADH-quinone oxidoreductase subunit N